MSSSSLFDGALPPARQPGEPRWPRRLAVALLSVHAIWVCTHLWLVSEDRINAWKLGGYGMYTVPSPRPVTHVFAKDADSGEWRELPMAAAETRGYDLLNFRHVFTCMPPREKAIARFIAENPSLRGRDFGLGISVRKMIRFPVQSGRAFRTVFEVRWTGPASVEYEGVLCEEPIKGAIDLQAGP